MTVTEDSDNKGEEGENAEIVGTKDPRSVVVLCATGAYNRLP